MPTQKQYTRTIARLTALLKKESLTAKQIAKRMGCNKLTVYRRLERLPNLTYSWVRESATGPESVAYRIKRRAGARAADRDTA